MYVSSVEILNFRNISFQRIELSAQFNIFSGLNGQGKTSILEALYVAAYGRSFRTAITRDLISRRREEENAIVEAQVKVEVVSEIGTKKIVWRASGGNVELFLNGNKLVSRSDILGELLIVSFSPDDLFLVKGGPEERRAFINRAAATVDRQYLEALIRFQRALKQRNVLIREAASSGIVDQAVFAPWNEQLAQAAEKLISRRLIFIERFSQISSQFYTRISDRHEELSVSLRSECISPNGGPLSLTEIHDRLLINLPKDIARGSTTFGPHRDDLAIILKGNGETAGKARQYASQGQIRSIVLAFKAAVAELFEQETGEQTVVLLDDVESELDEQRRFALRELFSNGKKLRQCLITGTNWPNFITDSNFQALYGATEYGATEQNLFEVDAGVAVPRNHCSKAPHTLQT